MPGEVIKFYCACGQKVGVPRDRVGSVGHCPRCNSPLEVPVEGTEPGGEKVIAAVKLQAPPEEERRPLSESRSGTECRQCGAKIGLLALVCTQCGAETVKRAARPRGTTRRRGRRERAQTARVERWDDGERPAGRLPLWFWLSFTLDAALFVGTWQIFALPWYYGLLLGEIAGWTVRVVGFKLDL